MAGEMTLKFQTFKNVQVVGGEAYMQKKRCFGIRGTSSAFWKKGLIS
jgi:hypothetical protein